MRHCCAVFCGNLRINNENLRICELAYLSNLRICTCGISPRIWSHTLASKKEWHSSFLLFQTMSGAFLFMTGGISNGCVNKGIGLLVTFMSRYMDKICIQTTYCHFPFFKAAFYTVFRIIIVLVAHFEENNPKWMAFKALRFADYYHILVYFITICIE